MTREGPGTVLVGMVPPWGIRPDHHLVTIAPSSSIQSAATQLAIIADSIGQYRARVADLAQPVRRHDPRRPRHRDPRGRTTTAQRRAGLDPGRPDRPAVDRSQRIAQSTGGSSTGKSGDGPWWEGPSLRRGQEADPGRRSKPGGGNLVGDSTIHPHFREAMVRQAPDEPAGAATLVDVEVLAPQVDLGDAGRVDSSCRSWPPSRRPPVVPHCPTRVAWPCKRADSAARSGPVTVDTGPVLTVVPVRRRRPGRIRPTVAARAAGGPSTWSRRPSRPCPTPCSAELVRTTVDAVLVDTEGTATLAGDASPGGGTGPPRGNLEADLGFDPRP